MLSPMKSTRIALLLAALLSIAAAVAAQTMVAKTITFTGAPQSQAELLTLSGLTPGKTLTKNEIDTAAARLDASGLFTSVQWGANAGVLTFSLEANASAQMERVQYGNFVWFTQAELNNAIHERLPLFSGSVPANGELKDQVKQTLVAVMRDRGLNVTVEGHGVAGGRFQYSIASPKVLVTDIKIDNVKWDSDPVLESVRHSQVDIDYIEGISQTGVRENVGYALKEIGYLDETVGPIGHGEPKLEGEHIGVVMTGSADPGSRYKVARVTIPKLAGSVTAADLESDHQVNVGGVPSPSLVENTVARMAYVYKRHGFLDAKSSVDSMQDHTAHTMSYTFSVVPGEAYHMRNLIFDPGMTADQKAQLTQVWKLPPGGVYERVDVDRSLQQVKTVCGGKPASAGLLPQPATHQVDVLVSCTSQR